MISLYPYACMMPALFIFTWHPLFDHCRNNLLGFIFVGFYVYFYTFINFPENKVEYSGETLFIN